jgi:hypothetical protein
MGLPKLCTSLSRVVVEGHRDVPGTVFVRFLQISAGKPPSPPDSAYIVGTPSPGDALTSAPKRSAAWRLGPAPSDCAMPTGAGLPRTVRPRCLPAWRIALPGARLPRGAAFTGPTHTSSSPATSEPRRVAALAVRSHPPGRSLKDRTTRVDRGKRCGTGCDPEGVRTP